MEAVSETPETTDPLSWEWQRLELLGQCLAQGRQGREIAGQTLDRLRELQARVDRSRARGGPLAEHPLSTLELDILLAVVGPEAEPRLGWLFQQLQPGASQPYPTPALLHELLALDGAEVQAFYEALGPAGILKRQRLIAGEGEDPYQPLRPGPGVVARLLGRPEAGRTPPGATRVHRQPGWDELILPADSRAMLEEYLHWIRYRETVVGAWGGVDTGGPIALFAGPSGTGKTLAAAVLAAELGWPLYRVDLGRLVSKYIGETEKNLNTLFDAAHDQPMVLQFDEADSLFGQRGEVKEARDRYANLEVSHLLARIEEHQGPVILTSNLREHLDPAFGRRFQMVVDFPRPDREARARLWERLLPPRAPRAERLDTQFLGKVVHLSGGAIRNAALHAAYLAAADEAPIDLPHVALAVWRERSKEGAQLAAAELGALARWLPEGLQ